MISPTIIKSEHSNLCSAFDHNPNPHDCNARGMIWKEPEGKCLSYEEAYYLLKVRFSLYSFTIMLSYLPDCCCLCKLF